MSPDEDATDGRPSRPIGQALDGGQHALRDGRVEQFSRSVVAGWVAVDIGSPGVHIALRVNGHEVASTSAGLSRQKTVPGADVRGFRLALSDLWHYVGPTDALTVTAGEVSNELDIVGHGRAFIPSTAGDRSPEALFTALVTGSLFSRSGRLQKSRTLATGWQRRIISAADTVRDLIRTHVGYDVFYAYGSMLGAVREAGFLGHDDDLDLGYMSRHRDGSEVGKEIATIAMMLIDNGLSVEPFGPVLHVYLLDADGRRGQRVDLFPHYFDAAGLLRTAWGWSGTPQVHIDQWTGVVQTPFGDGTAPVPSAAEAFLVQLYGDRWREPQPGFSWSLDRVEKAIEARLPSALGDEVYWADFYTRSTPGEPSDFCRAVLSLPTCPATVLDLGCGDGRDSIAIATTGRQVIALDTSPAGLARVAANSVAAHVTGLIDIAHCDVADPDQLSPHIQLAQSRGGPIMYYSRFLHDLTPEDDDRLLSMLANRARTGDMFAAEFRSMSDVKRRKAHASPRRHFRDGDIFARRLVDECGFAIMSSDHATGRSVYGAEDPDLHRIVAMH